MKPQEAPHLNEWMNATEIAEELHVSRTTVNQMVRRGEFSTLHTLGVPSQRPQYVVKRAEVEKFAASRGAVSDSENESA